MAWILTGLSFFFLLLFAYMGNIPATGVCWFAFGPLLGFCLLRAFIRWAGRQWRGNP